VTPDDTLREYLNWLRKTAGNMIGFGDPRLDDLIQEGYIAMWRALGTFSPDRGALPAWLTYKAHGRMQEFLRRAKNVPCTDLDAAPEEALAAPDLIDSLSLAYHDGEIAQAISHLSPAQRRYVTARFWLGLSGKEMRELGVFSYEAHSLWASPVNGARKKLAAELSHLAR
jgi:RNA polymerase sigma factor (sigma-70 family)